LTGPSINTILVAIGQDRPPYVEAVHQNLRRKRMKKAPKKKAAKKKKK
jgi:hypothetical protein